MEVSCIYCGRGFHKLCEACLMGRCHYDETESDPTSEPDEPKKLHLTDPESSGRKRAARLYPLDANAACEWQMKANCGGGRRPIIGCLDGKQVHRHHGPIKDTTHNELGNVHRICSTCHNRWHELNDRIYDEKDNRLMPHSPVASTDQEITAYELDWKNGTMAKRYNLKLNRTKITTQD